VAGGRAGAGRVMRRTPPGGLAALVVAVAACARAAAPSAVLSHPVSLAASGWSTYADGSASQRFPLANAAGALTFAFPRDAPPLFTAAGRSATAPSVDYLFTAAPVGDLRAAHALTASFTVAATPGAVLNARFEAANSCPGGATVRLLLSEYVKYVAAEVRVRLADAGLDLAPELAEQPTGSLPARRPATAQAN